MAKPRPEAGAPSAKSPERGFGLHVDAARDAGNTLTVKFGSVEVVVNRPSEAERLVNVLAGQSALRRAAEGISKPGVRVAPRKGVPQYRIDPEDPQLLIRRMDGVDVRGVFENGTFQVKG